MNRTVAAILAIGLAIHCGMASARYIQGDPAGILPSASSPIPPMAARALTAADVLRFHQLNHSYAYVRNNPLSNTDPWGLCPCKGGEWSQGANFGASAFFGGGFTFSKSAIFTCKSDSSLQCKGNVICIGGGPMIAAGAGADLFGDVYGAPDSNDLSQWSSGMTGSFGPVSGTGSFGGGGSVSLMKSFGGGVAYVSCRAYYVNCSCPCDK